jgi:predicted nucleic acid-binding Zn ribbon protein
MLVAYQDWRQGRGGRPVAVAAEPTRREKMRVKV